MDFLFWSNLIFWVCVALLLIGGSIYCVVAERIEHEQEELARLHRHKRRIQRFNNLNRNR
jgi:cytochrome c-type biogenesis protein CcmH/NrfF